MINYLNSIKLNELNMVFCERIDDKNPLWNFEKHSHDYIELIYFLEGKTRIDFKKNSIEVSMYNIIVHPPHIEHQEFLKPNFRQEVIALGIYLNSSEQLNSSFKIIDKDGILIWFFKHIHNEYKKNKVKSSQLINIYLQSIFLHMIRYFSNSYIEKSDIVKSTINYIHKNFDKDINVNQLATMVSVSSSYLNRIFKKKLNTTPIKYLNNFRIKIAKKLLISSEFSIKEITNNVGFADSCYFWRVFKKSTGISPSKFRKKFRYSSKIN